MRSNRPNAAASRARPLEIYAPIANRLGLNSIFQELEDLSFQHLYPARYRVLAKAVKSARGNRREVVEQDAGGGQAASLKDSKVEVQVHGREKHLYSIYRKMREKHLSFAQVTGRVRLPHHREGRAVVLSRARRAAQPL